MSDNHGRRNRMNHSKHIVIGVDQGTTNTKAAAVDASGKIVAQASRPIAMHAPEPGAVEQDAEAMVANVSACVREVIASAGGEPRHVAGLGIANQTETLAVWDRRTGKPAIPAMVWQCRRGTAEIAALSTLGLSTIIKPRTGLDLDPTFTASKLKWLSCHRPRIAEGLRNGDLLFGTVDTWLIWKLTGGAVYATEPGNASRTMLFDIDRITWDRELQSIFSLDIACLPECRLSNARFGETDPSVFGAPIPITGVMGDQQASLFGHGCYDEMQLKVTYGTGAFLWVNAGEHAREAPGNGIIRTIAWQIEKPCYAYEGFVMYAGKILEWLGQRLAVPGGAVGIAAEAERARTSAGVLLVPAFQGLASPWWQPAMRAALTGLSEATTNGHIAHAGLEAVCYQIRAVLDIIERHRSQASPLMRVDGGMARSSYFMQLQANVLRRSLSPASLDSTTPFGAALMAGLGCGMWGSVDQLREIIGVATCVLPEDAAALQLDRSYAAWLRAIEMLIDHGSAPIQAAAS
jgi:glycerol kinase